MASETERPSAIFMLKWPLLLLVVALIASGAMLGAAYLFLESEKKVNDTSQRMMGDARSRMSNANRELDDLKSSIDKFNSLKQRGAFSPENRLAWVEQMLQLQKAHSISSLEFELGARKKPVLQGNKSFSALDVFASPLSLKFKALHEGEALAFLGAVNQAQGSVFAMENCLMSRVGPIALVDPQPRVEVDCKAYWITLEDKRAATQPASTAPKGK